MVPLLVHRGLSAVQNKNVGTRGRRVVYDVPTEHGQVVIINCHVPHGKRVKEYVPGPQPLWHLPVGTLLVQRVPCPFPTTPRHSQPWP